MEMLLFKSLFDLEDQVKTEGNYIKPSAVYCRKPMDTFNKSSNDIQKNSLLIVMLTIVCSQNVIIS